MAAILDLAVYADILMNKQPIYIKTYKMMYHIPIGDWKRFLTRSP